MTSDKQLARQRRVLSAIRSRLTEKPDAEIDVGTLLGELHMPRHAVYASVLGLVDAGLLDYVGAGPKVRVTPRGLAHAEQLQAPHHGP